MVVHRQTVVQVKELGHVSLYVRDLKASVGFYRDVLGLKESGRGKGGRIAFLTAGRHHHDLSLEAAHRDDAIPPKGAPGLYHIAFCIGSSQEELEAARDSVRRQGHEPFGETGVVRDPAVFFLSRYNPPVHTLGVVLKVSARSPRESPSGMCFPAQS